jgi:hypothetical protein
LCDDDERHPDEPAGPSEELYRSDAEPGRLVWVTFVTVALVQWNAVFEGALLDVVLLLGDRQKN